MWIQTSLQTDAETVCRFVAFVIRDWFCPKNVSGDSEQCINSACVCVHVCELVFIVNWSGIKISSKALQQRLGAENERRTREAIGFIQEQKWRRGEREKGWKDVICGLNPNWITLITSLFLDLFSMFFHLLISFKPLPSMCKCFTLEFLQSISQ